jgi:hypothetical protein
MNKHFQLLKKIELVLYVLVGYLVIATRFPATVGYRPTLDHYFGHYITLMGIGLIIFHLVVDIYQWYFVKQPKLEKLETLSAVEVSADDERELLAKYEAGYFTYMTLQSLINSLTFVVWIVAIVLRLLPYAMFWGMLILSFIGQLIYLKELRARDVLSVEKLEKKLRKGKI